MNYSTYDPIESVQCYICQDQATIDKGKALGYQGVFSVGTEQDALNMLTEIRTTWFAQNVGLFSVNKDTDATEGTVWTACNLDEEPANYDERYQVFEVVKGYYIEATGTYAAQELFQENKTNALNYFIPMASFATWPKKSQPEPV
jgi:hypothetical protein